MATNNQLVQSGNIIRVEFDGANVGLVQSVRMADDYSPEPASGIGDIHVQEHVPTMARHTLNVTSMVLKKQNMRQQGISALNGDDVLKGIVFDIVVYDKLTGRELRRYQKCSYASGEIEINKHQILMHTAQFNAIDVKGGDL